MEKQRAERNRTLTLSEEEKQKDKLKALTEYYNEAKSQAKELAKAESEMRKAKLASGQGNLKDLTAELSYQFKNKIMTDLKNSMSNVMATYSEYQRNINTRLQGTNESFFKLQNKLNLAVGVQPYIKNEKLMQNLNTLTEQGIAYNLEQRAFLMTISENIAKTFDAANASLLRIVTNVLKTSNYR